MATFHLTTLLRRTAHRTGVLVAALALAGAPGRAAAQQVNACYVPSVGAVYLIGLTGLPTACLAPSHVPVTLGGGALADGSVTTVKLADGAVNGAKLANFLQMDNGFFLTGNAGLGTIPHEGPGVGMMWYPRKLAFRSGWVTGTQWDDANVGFASTALGKNTTASGPFSTALGMNASTNGLEGTFVYGDASQDNTSFLVMPTAANQFVVRASGGVRFFTSPDLTVGCDIAALGFGDLHCTGMIHSAFGGFKFPDGTLQTTAATAGGSGDITEVLSGSGLTGGGSTGSVTLSVSFAGPGAAATVARSDHTHATAGFGSTAVGDNALAASSTLGSNNNTAVGSFALAANTTGQNNTAVGRNALRANTIGGFWGGMNTAVGSDALFSSTGGYNIALGVAAGANVTTGNYNIHIGDPGLSTDDLTIRIGNVQTQTFIAGISGSTSAGGTAVFVNASGQLGTLTSSARFKEGVEDLGETSRRLLRLRPVQFRYKPEYDDGSRLVQYGLIAEEVAEVFPELVAYRPSGEVETVRYHLFPALLLNELQRQEQELVALRQAVEELRAELRRRQR